MANKKMTSEEAAAQGLVPYYNGYYRDSAKYKTEWICIVGSYDRHEVNKKLKREIQTDRFKGHYGSRMKIERVFIKPKH